MSTKRKLLIFVAAVTVVVGASTVGALSAGAGSTACGSKCVSVFSKELGTYAQPGFFEDIQDGVAAVGQPVILKEASATDPSEDTIPHRGKVSDFYAAGMVSADANSHYGNLFAAQIEYAPNGVGSGLCVGLAEVAYQNEGLTLQPCTVPALTVWILDTPDSPSTAPAYFPIVNASTTDFTRPFAMNLTQDELANDHKTLQIIARHLQFQGKDKTLPDRELWGVYPGALH